MAQESRLVIVIDAKNAERNARNLGNELDSIERKGEFASKSMDNLSVATRALAGYMAGLVTVSSAISKMDTYTGLQNRLKLVTNNQVELNKATEDTFRIAQKTYSAWDSVLQVYQRFSDNAKTLNLTMDDTARLTETVSKAVAISGASAEAADAALVQFGQALASGTLRGEELNSVMEQTPALAKAIAKGMGITVGELRSVAAEGKITSQEIVKALKNVQDEVDALFAKTDITIGQSLTLLNNEITKFVGEAGKGSGAAQVLAGSVQTLASNLDLIADGALVVGIGYITRAILMKSAAIKEGMASTLASRQASVLNAQAEYAEATAALNAAKAHLANVRATNAETQAKFGATAAATRYAQAQAAVTAATNAQTAAQIKLNTATSIAGRLAKGAFGLIGGWAGVATLGVMGLAATYSYFNNKAEEAKQKLAEQAKVAEKADEELKKLTGNDKAKAVNDLTTAFNAQNKALEKSSRAVGSALIDIENYARGNREVEKISQEARTGTISYTEAIERLNKIKLPTDLYENLKKQAAQYDDNASKASLSAEKLKLLRVEVKLGGNEAQNAAIKQQKHADALGNTATEAEKATKALQDYQAKQKDSVIDSIYKSGWLDKGYTVAQANAILELQKAKGMSAILSKDEIDSALRNLKIIEEQQEREDKLTEAKRKQTKESEKKLKITQAELEVAKRSAALIESSGLGKYAESKGIPSSVIAGLLAQESKGIREAKSHTGAIGYFQTTSGYRKQNNMSVADSYDLEKSGKIVIDNIAKVYEKTGDLAQAILSHNAGEGGARQFTKTGKVKGSAERNKEVSQYVAKVSRYSDIIAGGVGKGGLSDGDSDRAYGEQIKARLELVKQGLNLQEQYEEEQAKRTKARNEEINLAQQTGQTALIPKIKERYKAQDELAKLQQDFEVNGYKWTEEQKLDYTYKTNSLRLVAEGKLSEDQRKVALDGLEQQKQQELELIQSTREKQLLEAKSSYMGETELAIRRYQIELDEIKKVADEKRKAGLLSANNMGQFQTLDSASDKVFQSGFNASQQVFQQNDPRGYAQWDLQNRYSTDAGGLLNTYIDQTNGINLIADEEQRSSQLLAAREQYLQSRKALDEKYAQDERDLNSSLFETQLGQLDSLTSQLSGYWSNMTGIVKNAAGEQSGIYKGMYIAQQAFAIGSATISALQAYNQILASPWYLDVISKSTAANLVLGMGMANVGLIAGQTIAGFSDGGYTGSGGKYQPAGIVHKGEVVWSQEDIKRWGGVGLVEKMRKSANPEAFLNNNASADSVMRRALMSSNAFIESQKQADIFNQPVQDTQIIYKGNRDTPKLASSANSDLFHDGKVYFSSNGFVQDRSNLEDVQDFTMGQAARPQAEIMPSIEPASPTINFKIEVINQVSGATVEAEQLDEQTVRIIVKDELDKQLPRTVPKLVSDQIGNPNSTISRSLTENTTVRRNR
ncbi:tape measure domain protein [Acinetobacter baumannii 25493_8]|uniref:tape measure protein n=5 Tax=Acinetobacter baumannii TaxID=470 RepID=UPI0004488DBC|nr:tape measure protein [Acinetobacter baumannii]EIG0126925.1 tape measure protein [Acinetobacter baumannii]EXA75553.1 tape measure domain protein [Acinetobacter baumannii 1202252]EXA76660.1 tape measure domain protein [Acinetobacter baumannii 1202252]EXA76810.1 tape measure domain protein [Acinetobacter baumannii 1202252]EXD22063.1 tape measure domain protein [Acinetobacter baumannii 29280]